jgi:hypothetical protein
MGNWPSLSAKAKVIVRQHIDYGLCYIGSESSELTDKWSKAM